MSRNVIPITRPWVGDEEAAAAAAAVRSGWLSQGRRVQAFEEAVAAYCGAAHAVATTNCTTALHLALVALGVGAGDEVICPSFSFIATANAILQAGATPVFVDIDPESYTIDPAAAEAAITPRTRALMPVDQIGLAADLTAIGAIARRHGLPVVEDAAPAIGAGVGEARVGSLADATCFSFHPRKSITCGEGGMVLTGDPALAARLRRLRSHGASVSDLARHESGGLAFETYDEPGFNARMTDIQAAVGLVQMAKLDTILVERRRLAERYTALLADDGRVRPPVEPRGRRHTYQSYCIRLDAAVDRAAVMAAMAEAGVATRRGVMAIHREPFYAARFPGLSLPETERAAEETLLLPLFVGMTEAEQDRVVTALRAALARSFRPRVR